MISRGVTHLREIYKRQQLRKSMGVPFDALLLLSVGELNQNKNHEIVLRAMEKLDNPSLHYVIAGTGELHDHLECLTKLLGLAEQVHLLGFRNDVAELYKTADLFVHPSLREGLPAVVMEAIASKMPVICSDIRGNVDLVSENALFTSNDIDALVGKICMCISNNCITEVEKNYQN